MRSHNARTLPRRRRASDSRARGTHTSARPAANDCVVPGYVIAESAVAPRRADARRCDSSPEGRMLRGWIERALASVSGEPVEPPAESRIVDGIRVDVINTRPDIDTERVFRRAEAIIRRIDQY